MEFSITYDVLVRGGVDVTSVYVPGADEPLSPADGLVVASRGVKLGADTTLEALTKSGHAGDYDACLLYTSPSPRDQRGSRMPSSA